MFIMMSAGYILYKKEIVNDDITSRLSNILLMITTPCMIVGSFNQTFSTEKLTALLLSFGLCCLIYFMNILLAKIMYPKHKETEKFTLVFSNAGFLGIPLVTGVLGVEAVFYLAPYISLFYVFAWTYGVVLMSGDKSTVTPKKILYNPCIWE